MKVLVFGGTTEGRLLARELSALGAQVTVSVATALGAEELRGVPPLTVCVGRKDARQMRLPDALLIGAAQAVSVLPGLSRTGLTVAAGLYRGAKAEFSLEYSFLLAVPFWLGAGIIRIIQGCVAGVTAARLPAYLAGAIVCVLAARFALASLRQLTRKKSWSHFAFYSWAAAVFSIFLFLIT